MNANPHSALHPWTKDLEASRDVNPRQREGFAMVLGWFETFRSRHRLAANRETCILFWKEQVKVKERPAWQLEQWAAAIEWYLRWVKNSRDRGDDTRTLEERVRDAVERAGCRRGLARLTRETYGWWVRQLVGSDRAVAQGGLKKGLWIVD